MENDLRRWLRLVEGDDEPRFLHGSEDNLNYALWWVQRWVSGSMTDPDWEWPEAEAMGVDAAFTYLQSTIGNRLSIGKPLWRYLAVSGQIAVKIAATKIINPHEQGFQSFTPDRSIAHQFGKQGHERAGIIVCVEPPSHDVMFGMADLLKNKRTGGWLLALEDWHHQDEEIVRVHGPLQVRSVEKVKS